MLMLTVNTEESISVLLSNRADARVKDPSIMTPMLLVSAEAPCLWPLQQSLLAAYRALALLFMVLTQDID